MHGSASCGSAYDRDGKEFQKKDVRRAVGHTRVHHSDTDGHKQPWQVANVLAVDMTTRLTKTTNGYLFAQNNETVSISNDMYIDTGSYQEAFHDWYQVVPLAAGVRWDEEIIKTNDEHMKLNRIGANVDRQ